MRVIGRLLCALLALAFLVSLCPPAALAAEESDTAGVPAAAAPDDAAEPAPGEDADASPEEPGFSEPPEEEPGEPGFSEASGEEPEESDPSEVPGEEPEEPDPSDIPGEEPGGAEYGPAPGVVTFYASWFVDGTALTLTADTWLIMDQARTFSSISGDYALTVTGAAPLTVVSAAGTGISAASLDCRTGLEIRAAGEGIAVSGSVLLRQGAAIEAGAGAVRAGGGVTVEGDFSASAGSADAYCVYSTGSGDVLLRGGNIHISSTANAVVAQGGGITLDGNSVEIRAEGGRSVALNPRGGDMVILGGTVYAVGGSCAIYSLRGISMKGGTLIASGGIVAADGNIAITGVVDAAGVNTGTVYALSGGITVEGRLTARTTQADKYCVVASGDVTLIGAADITSTANGIVSQEGGITLDGEMRISASGAASVAINSRGGDVLLRAGTIEATGGSCAIYSLRGIAMEDGTLLVAHGGVVAARGDLTLAGVVSVEGKNTAALYAPEGSVNVSGGLTATAAQAGQAAVLSGGDISLAGELNLQAQADAVRARGGVELQGEGMILSTSDGTVALTAEGGPVRLDGAFTLSGGARALQAAGGVEMAEYLWVAEPEGALISDTTVLTADAYPAPYVRVAARYLSGTISLGETVPEVGQTLRISAKGEAAELIGSGAQAEYWWLRSADGEEWEVLSRPGDAPDSLLLLAEDAGYYVRAAVTVPGRAGALFSEILTVRRAENDADPAVPELLILDGVLYVSIAKTEQEYLLRTEAADPEALTEEDWAAAVVPRGAYSLALEGVPGETNYVYTRLRGTDSTEPGWKVAAASAYLPVSIPVRMLLLRTEGLISDAEGSHTPWCREGDGLKITAEAVPASATGYSGIRGDAWQAVGSDGEPCGSFYADSASTEPLQADQFYEDVWYLTGRADENVTITASYNRGYDDILTARMSFRVAAAVEYYPLLICGINVTSENREDLGALLAAQSPEARERYEAGALVMSFDGDRTLTVCGDFSSYDIIVENLGVEGLIINVTGDTTLTSLVAAALSLQADTTVTGAGSLSLSGSTAAVQVTDGAALTVFGISISASGNRGFCGADGGERLIVENAALDLRGVRGAVSGFDGGIVLTRCALAEPENGRTDGGRIVDGDGRTAASAVITAAGVTEIALSDDCRTARITGSFTDLYARVALVLESAAGSGLYVVQARIEEDGTVPIPSLSIPGLTVLGVNVALVESLDDIPTPSPVTVCSCFALF